MAELNIFDEIGGELVSRIFGSILWFGLFTIIILMLGGLMYYFLYYRKKFDIRVKIISHRSKDKNTVLFDKAAILKDWVTKLPCLKIWGLKRSFPVPKYNVLQSTHGGDYLEIYRKSEEEFYFLTPPSIEKEYIIKEDGRKIAMANQKQVMVDPEMGFWNIKRKSMNKNMFDVEHWAMKVIPYIPHIFSGVIMIFILYIFLDHLPGILASLDKLVQNMAALQKADVVTG